ncbi:MAG: polyprenol monophosphomannose synthase [Saprospiraceae bacterium]
MALPVRFDVLVVDDGSPDETASIVESFKARYPGHIFLMQRGAKLGLGTAYIAGFKWGIQQAYDYLYEMDADFSHPPEDLVRLYQDLVEHHDVSVGSRYIRGGKVENWPFDRILLSYGASWYVRLITWMPVKDPTAGFVGYKRKVLEAIDLDQIRFIGYAFQIEMKYAARSLGFSVGEIPITFRDRIAGESKIHSSIITEAIWGVIKMRFRSFVHSYRRQALTEAGPAAKVD